MAMYRPQERTTVVFSGGLDLVTPPHLVEPGKLYGVKNYECDLNGGYRQAAGFERFDGQESPSDGSYYAIQTATPSGTFTDGETLTQAVSGATGLFLQLAVGGIYMVSITGTFNATDVITGGTSLVTATAQSVTTENSTLSDAEDRQDVRYAKEIMLRDVITVVPGINAVRGACRFDSRTIAVRDFDGVEARMYKSTAAGWVVIGTSHVLFYDTKTSTIPINGTLIDDGVGNTATLHRTGVVNLTENTGYIVLSGYTTGFAAGAIMEDDAGGTPFATVATGGAPAEFKLAPLGKSEWQAHTFSGSVNQYRLYMTDGVNPCIEYDPDEDVISPIYTDQSYIATDIPKFVSIYRNHLFVGYERGVIRSSEPGDPYLWDAAAGAMEVHIGAPVTGFDSAPQSLIVTTSRTTYALTGQTLDGVGGDPFQLDVASAQTGARPYTVQHIGTTHMLDDRGIIELSRVQAFGNFENATISRLIQPLLKSWRADIIASSISLTNNIYKMFRADGTGISVTFQEGQILGFSQYDLTIGINTLCNTEDETGTERLFVGSTDGFVYELDKGRSFDGVAKECWLRTVFQYVDSPRDRKRFYRAYFDTVVTGSTDISVYAEYSRGDTDVLNTSAVTNTIAGYENTWDTGLWDIASFDATTVSEGAYLDLTGTGDSISLILYSNSAIGDIITFKDVIYKYKMRRSTRGA